MLNTNLDNFASLVRSWRLAELGVMPDDSFYFCRYIGSEHFELRSEKIDPLKLYAVVTQGELIKPNYIKEPCYSISCLLKVLPNKTLFFKENNTYTVQLHLNGNVISITNERYADALADAVIKLIQSKVLSVQSVNYKIAS